MIVATIMLTGVVFVTTFDQPPSSTANARTDLGQRARDVLAILADTPASSSGVGDSQLSEFIHACLLKNCDPLKDALTRLAPPGAAYALYVSNGQQTFPVLVEAEPSGEAVTSSLVFEPRWSSSFVATASDSIKDGAPLVTYSLPIFNSQPVTGTGSHLMVRVIGTRSDSSHYVLQAAYTTEAQAVADPTKMAASFHFIDAAGNPLAAHNAAALTMSGATPSGTPIRLQLKLAETQGGILSHGTEVRVQFPRGWVGEARGVDNAGWDILSAATSAQGNVAASAIRAQLNDSLSFGSATLDAERVLTVHATYQGDELDWYPFTATLGRGTASVASLLVRAQNHTADPISATPSVLLSVPKPMGADAETTWTLSAQIPTSVFSNKNDLTRTVQVTRVEIEEEEGHGIFASEITTLQGAGGTFTSEGNRLIWTGSVVLDADTALNLSFKPRASGVAGPSGRDTLFIPPLTTNGQTIPMTAKSAAGFYRTAVLGEDTTYAGYDRAAVGHDGIIRSDPVRETTLLPGGTNYTLNDLSGVEDSIWGSYVEVDKRLVPVGGEALFDISVQSVLFALAEAGQKAGVTLRVYPPWGGASRTAWHTSESLDQGILAGEVTAMTVLDVNGDGFPDPVIGTTNGRVFAANGLTGIRIEGSSFTAPLTTAATEAQLVPRIKELDLIDLFGETYIVATTDQNSDGVFVLHRNMSVAWSYPLRSDIIALSVDTDWNGDGTPEIVVARYAADALPPSSLIYVFKAVVGDPVLQLITGTTVVATDARAFTSVPGRSGALLSLPAAGPTGGDVGLAAGIQTSLVPGIEVNPTIDRGDPAGGALASAQVGSSGLPRAGLQGIDRNGQPTSTLFGVPVTVARATQYGAGDTVTDIVAGSSAGFVSMVNGTVYTQPLYSYIPLGPQTYVDADIRSGTEVYALTDDGQILYTDDAWATTYCVNIECSYYAPTANAIATDRENSFWVVGDTGLIMRSEQDPAAADPTAWQYYPSQNMVPVLATPTRGGLPYSMIANIHDLRDIWFRDQTGWIVGDRCAVLCTEAFVMGTTDGGTTWTVATKGSGLEGLSDTVVNADLKKVEFMPDGTGWILGKGGTVLRRSVGDNAWRQVALPATYDLNSIACKPGTPDTCMLVGEAGAAFRTYNARAATPEWENLTGTFGLPTDRELYTVGWSDAKRVYVGTSLRVMMSYDNASFSAMPLNYLQNDARVIASMGDGTGYMLGGSAAQPRIWQLHDHHYTSQAVTASLAPQLAHLAPGSYIQYAYVSHSNISRGLAQLSLSMKVGAEDWQSMGPLIHETSPTVSDRDFRTSPKAPTVQGTDLRFKVGFTTSGDSTISSPYIRELTLTAICIVPGEADPVSVAIPLDFSTRTMVDETLTTADWNETHRFLRHPLVDEYWTRSVTGSVADVQTGFDLTGDGRADVYIGTGAILAESSPDHLIYTADPDEVVGYHNRTYLLDGTNGSVLAISPELLGEVRHMRISDADDDGTPDAIFVTTFDSNASQLLGRLYSLDPITLAIQWERPLGREDPQALAVGNAPQGHSRPYAGGSAVAAGVKSVGRVRAFNGTTSDPAWDIIPSDIGQYNVRVPIPKKEFFGAYVAEVEVSWEETVTGENQEVTEYLRSLRFYDHFVVTPPDLLSPPSPLYSVRLLMWMRDWG